MRVRRRRASRRCATSSSAPRDWSAGEEEALRAERERMRHAAELAEGAARGDGRRRTRGRGRAPPRSRPQRARLGPLTRLAPELEAAACGAPRADRAPERGRERPAPVRRLARGRSGAHGGGRGPPRPDRRAAAAFRARRRWRSCSSVVARRAELDALDGGLDPLAAAAAGSRGPRSSSRRDRRGAPRGAKRRSGEPFAAAVAREPRGRRHGGGRVPRGAAASASPGPSGRDEAAFLIRPNPGMAVRAGRRHGLGRRALARGARACRRRGRRDARLRRDRRRHRRRHRPPRGRDAERGSRSVPR